MVWVTQAGQQKQKYGRKSTKVQTITTSKTTQMMAASQRNLRLTSSSEQKRMTKNNKNSAKTRVNNTGQLMVSSSSTSPSSFNVRYKSFSTSWLVKPSRILLLPLGRMLLVLFMFFGGGECACGEKLWLGPICLKSDQVSERSKSIILSICLVIEVRNDEQNFFNSACFLLSFFTPLEYLFVANI